MSKSLQTFVKFLTIDESQSGQRLDNFLLAHLKDVPKSRIYRLIRKGEVRVNKHRIKPDYRLQADDIVRIPPISHQEKPNKQIIFPDKIKQLLKEAIIYEDAELLVINKPSKLAVHGGSQLKFGVIEVLRDLFPHLEQLELVHRLDRDTSGALMLSKTYHSLKKLHQMLKDGQILKEYWCLVHGCWPEQLTKVELPLKKYQLQSGERMVQVDPVNGKAALTQFQVRQRIGKQFTVLSAFPITGRTHQIRVHTKASGFPIVGDSKYGDSALDAALKAKGINRLCLHALKLVLHMEKSENVIEAPLPQELFNIINGLDD